MFLWLNDPSTSSRTVSLEIRLSISHTIKAPCFERHTIFLQTVACSDENCKFRKFKNLKILVNPNWLLGATVSWEGELVTYNLHKQRKSKEGIHVLTLWNSWVEEADIGGGTLLHSSSYSPWPPCKQIFTVCLFLLHKPGFGTGIFNGFWPRLWL